MKKLLCIIVLAFVARTASSQIVIAALVPNPAGIDSAYEYIQLLATENIDFSLTPYCVVAANNGTAGVSGWAQGGNTTFKYDLTSGTVHTGEIFYTGGDSKRINGPGSTDISSEKWIRAINSVVADGDGFGLHNASGVIGNAGANADGIAVFAGTTVNDSTIPLDAIFYGLSVGNALSSGNGYTLPDNDHYLSSQGQFGEGTNQWFVFIPGNARDTLISFSGIYDTVLNTWIQARNDTMRMLITSSQPGELASGIILTGDASSVNQPESNPGAMVYYSHTSGCIEVVTGIEGSYDYIVTDIPVQWLLPRRL